MPMYVIFSNYNALVLDSILMLVLLENPLAMLNTQIMIL